MYRQSVNDMFFVCLVLALFIILTLIFKHARSQHKILINVTIFMIMTGIMCWGYNDINLASGHPSPENNTVLDALINQPLVWTIGMSLLILSVPCALFCILSKPKKIEEIDKLLEDQDNID